MSAADPHSLPTMAVLGSTSSAHSERQVVRTCSSNGVRALRCGLLLRRQNLAPLAKYGSGQIWGSIGNRFTAKATVHVRRLVGISRPPGAVRRRRSTDTDVPRVQSKAIARRPGRNARVAVEKPSEDCRTAG